MNACSEHRSVRRASVEDIPLIRQLAGVVFPATYREILSPGQIDYMMEWMYSPEALRQQMDRDGHVYFLGFSGDVPCGYVSVQPRGPEEDGTALFELQKIYVLPSFQKQRLGHLLFSHACAFARKQAEGRPCRIELHVNRSNAAADFYRRQGMEILREGDFPIGNGYYMNDYVMGMAL